jgi:LDH2 family malate/lactate/ureidoglycolate dehydrogenase
MQPGLFHSKMQAFMAEIKSSQLRPGFKEVLIPGEIEHRRASEKRANGVPFPESDLQQLIELADRLGIDGGALRAAAA